MVDEWYLTCRQFRRRSTVCRDSSYRWSWTSQTNYCKTERGFSRVKRCTLNWSAGKKIITNREWNPRDYSEVVPTTALLRVRPLFITSPNHVALANNRWFGQWQWAWPITIDMINDNWLGQWQLTWSIINGFTDNIGLSATSQLLGRVICCLGHWATDKLD